MALTVWTQPSGYTFGTFAEREPIEQSLPVTNDTGVTYSVISGALPAGLRINGNKLVGTPYEVPRITEFRFCVRASRDSEISDRTFKITIEGADAPEFITPEGYLPIGDHQQYFVLDSSFVDFQIEAVDFDTASGQRLHFYIASGDGELPPGLVLTSDGRIVGQVQPVLAIKPEDGDGTYDNSYYDAVAFDFAVRPSNGYDSYIYDNVFYDYNLSSNVPKKLNRNYEFIVSVTDGDSISTRKFKIFVVGDDYFRADNTVWLNGTGLFTADVTYLRAPVWLTPSDLGIYRANNFVTLVIDTYDTENVIYNLEIVNADITAKSKQLSPTDNLAGSIFLTIAEATTPVVGQYLTFTNRVPNATSKVYQIASVAVLDNNEYRLTLDDPLEINIPNDINFLIGTLSELPLGTSFDANNAEVFGQIPYQPAITTTYNFTISATRISDKGELASSFRKFTAQVIGEIDSIINWVTDSDLGTINANFISLLKVEATTTVENSVLLYKVVGGRLPPGLSLNLDGEIVGKVNQYGVTGTSTLGLTTFDYQTSVTTFDNSTSSFDRVYRFIVEVRDVLNYSATTKTFNITIDTPNELIFSNIRTRPYLVSTQRNSWQDFINNTSVFTPNSIYRSNDPSFGLQTDLSMIVYAGIETTEAAKYISAIGLNHKKKRFHFGDVKKATAITPGTKNEVYEVVYIEMLDPLEPNGKRLNNKIQFPKLNTNSVTVDNSKIFWSRSINDLSIAAPDSRRNEPYTSVDSTGYIVSDPAARTYFPNSISNWRDRLKNWRDNSESFASERNYLPLWMRSIQPGTKTELGFTLAVPLCYCKVGTADDIILNIKYSGFDFKSLDYTVDRYIIDSVEGETGDKYLVFKNDRITV